ncbi:MAG: transposase [Candidatus Acidiferrales bacterium]
MIQTDEGEIQQHLGEVVRSKVSKLNQKIYAQIETWHNQLIEGNHPYVILYGLWLKRNWGGEKRNVSLLVAIGVHEEGLFDFSGNGSELREFVSYRF